MNTSFLGQFPTTRLRRLRHHPVLRTLIQNTRLDIRDFIQPLFVKENITEKQAIKSMPGMYQLTLTDLAGEIDALSHLGIGSVLLFGIPAEKNKNGSASWQKNGIIQQTIRLIKEVNSEILVIADVCFCEYTSHGHCGEINEHTGKPDVDNDKTLEMLAKQALSFCEAGADLIAPSGMIDGMVSGIRNMLDGYHFEHIPLLSYSAKFASSFYGPFREAAEGAPQFGDRRTYQMDPANQQEALREVALDLQEGADLVMVKPALPYLDVISQVKTNFPGVPLVAYQVSGEYAMIKAASEKGWINEEKIMIESLTAIKRAGANAIISYACKDVAQWLK